VASYPEEAPLVSDTVEIWPGATEGKVKVKYFAGKPAEFAFYVPKTP
jgi:hypothetical protein